MQCQIIIVGNRLSNNSIIISITSQKKHELIISGVMCLITMGFFIERVLIPEYCGDESVLS